MVNQYNRCLTQAASGFRPYIATVAAVHVRDASRRRGTGSLCRATSLALPFLLTACNHAPQQDVLGSFFPAWMLCAALGVLVTIIVRAVLGLVEINAYVPVPPMTYLCCAALVTMLVWLGWFGQ